MSTTEFAFFVFLVTGALARLLGLDRMMRKLRSSLRIRSRDFAGCQKTHPRSGGTRAPGSDLTSVIVLEARRLPQAADTACQVLIRKRDPRLEVPQTKNKLRGLMITNCLGTAVVARVPSDVEAMTRQVDTDVVP